MFGSTTKRYLILATLGMAVPCLAGEMPKQFQLGQYIPQRAWLYTTTAHNPERAWIDGQWQELWDAVKQSGLEQDARDLALTFVPNDKKASAISTIDSLVDIAHVAVDCLKAEEIAFSESLAKQNAKYEYILLFRFKPAEAEQRYQTLVEKFKTLSQLSSVITVAPGEHHGLEAWDFGIRGIEEIAHIPTSGTIFRHKDIVGVVTGELAIRDVIGLLRGQSNVVPIVESAMFKRALAQVPTPEDSLVYFDYPAAMKDIRRLITVTASENTSATNEPNDQSREKSKQNARTQARAQARAQEIQKLIDKIMSLVDMNDFEITSTYTEGRQQRTHIVTGLRADALNKPLAQAIYNRKPFDQFDRYIPVNAKSFSVSVNVDLEIIYDTIMDLVEHDIPNSDRLLTKMKNGFDMIGFDPKRDLFSWLSGETISVSLPASFVSPMSSDDWVVMVRVKDTALASSKINGAINSLNALLQSQGQVLMVSPASVDAAGFKQVTHPIIAMFFKPVIGVTNDWLIVGSNAAAVNKCLAVATGQAPSIMKNKRFLKQGLIPDGPVNSLSFTDTSAFGNEAASMAGGLAMGINMASMSLMSVLQSANKNEDHAKVTGEVIQRLSGMLAKAGPILAKLDFYSSEAIMSSFDGRFSKTVKVVTYKSPEELGQTATVQAR